MLGKQRFHSNLKQPGPTNSMKLPCNISKISLINPETFGAQIFSCLDGLCLGSAGDAPLHYLTTWLSKQKETSRTSSFSSGPSQFSRSALSVLLGLRAFCRQGLRLLGLATAWHYDTVLFACGPARDRIVVVRSEESLGTSENRPKTAGCTCRVAA